MHMYFNNMYGNTYIWVWTCILWYVLVLVLKLWNMYSSISISCSMCMVMFARVGVKTFMILYEPLWSCMILYDPLCVYRIIYIYCIHVRACYIHIYIYVPVISCYSGTRRTPFWPPSAMKPLAAKSGRVGFGDRYHAGRGISINHCLVLYTYM